MSPRARPIPPKVLEVATDDHGILEASAGTGKTFTLEHLVVDRVLRGGVPLEAMLVVTYTEKATFELRARVRKMFESLLDESSAGATDARDFTADPGTTWVLDAKARKRIAASLAKFDTANIFTIHGFCHRVLAELAFERGQRFDEKHVAADEIVEDATRETFAEVLGAGAGEDAKAWLEAALEEGADVENLVETVALAAKSAHPVDPTDPVREDILATGASLLAPRFSADGLAAWIKRSTAEGRSKGGLREATLTGRLLAHRAAFEELAAGGSVVAFARALGSLEKERDALDVAAKWEGFLPGLEFVRPALALASTFYGGVASRAVAALVPLVRARVRSRKHAEGLFDFDDMLRSVDDALQGPSGPAIVERLRRRYRVAFIDEFQDTDDVQWRIFRRVFFESGRKNLLYVIGDPKQAIYGFRGADVGTYLEARRTLEASGVVPVRLASNFRSTPGIVTVTNALFGESTLPPFFTGGIDYRDEVRAGRPDFALVDRGGAPVSSLHLLPVAEGTRGGDVVVALASRIAEELREVLPGPGGKGGSLAWSAGGERRPLRPSDVFVLVQRVADAATVARVLAQAGIPVAQFKARGLFRTDEARHVHTLLEAVADPFDAAKRMAAWLTPFFGLTLADVADRPEPPTDHPLVARLVAWNDLARERKFEELFADPPRQWARREDLFLERTERRITNVLHVFDVLALRARSRETTLHELAATLFRLMSGDEVPDASEGDLQRLETDRDAVQVMTMHASKGLEATLVFVAGGFSPPAPRKVVTYRAGSAIRTWVGTRPEFVDASAAAESAAESERLLYVALTRAKGRLYLPEFLGKTRGDVLYERLNARLRTWIAPDAPVPASLAALVSRDVRTISGADSVLPTAPALRFDDVVVPDVVLVPDDPAELARIRRRATGALVTSYTDLKSHSGGYVSPWDVKAADRGDVGDAEAGATSGDTDPDGRAGVRRDPSSLPSGPATGIFLHAVLETVPCTTFSEGLSFDAWRSLPVVATTFDRAMTVHRIPAAAREEAERIVHAAMTMPIPLDGGSTLAGVARADRVAREVEFAFSVGRGFVKGVVDVLFRVGPRVFVLDWKSDQLPTFDDAFVAGHVARNYALQAELYVLAATRHLGIRTRADYEARFGGVIYAFVRAMPSGAGVLATRPTWDDVTGWAESLVGRREFSRSP
ncbi:MAG: UvrD-helicase domain-containing protein [Polyangiaceae bacterium]